MIVPSNSGIYLYNTSDIVVSNITTSGDFTFNTTVPVVPPAPSAPPEDEAIAWLRGRVKEITDLVAA